MVNECESREQRSISQSRHVKARDLGATTTSSWRRQARWILGPGGVSLLITLYSCTYLALSTSVSAVAADYPLYSCNGKKKLKLYRGPGGAFRYLITLCLALSTSWLYRCRSSVGEDGGYTGMDSGWTHQQQRPKSAWSELQRRRRHVVKRCAQERSRRPTHTRGSTTRPSPRPPISPPRPPRRSPPMA